MLDIEIKENACECGVDKENEALGNAIEKESNTNKYIDFTETDVNGLIRWIKQAKLSKKYELLRVLLKDPETRCMILEVMDSMKYGK